MRTYLWFKLVPGNEILEILEILFRSCHRQKWFDLRQTKTKMINGPCIYRRIQNCFVSVIIREGHMSRRRPAPVHLHLALYCWHFSPWLITRDSWRSCCYKTLTIDRCWQWDWLVSTTFTDVWRCFIMELGELYAAISSTNQRRESSATCWDTGTHNKSRGYRKETARCSVFCLHPMTLWLLFASSSGRPQSLLTSNITDTDLYLGF